MTRLRTMHRRGYTLVEIVIAASLLVLASSMAMGTLVYTQRVAKSQHSMLRLGEDCIHFQRLLKQHATAAEKFVVNQGKTLEIVQPDGTKGMMVYYDGDGNNDTLADNYIEWDPDVSSAGDRKIVIERISPLPGVAIFEQPATNTAVIRINFRMGDRSANYNHDNDVSGAGMQAFVMSQVYTARNNASQ